MGRPRSIFGLLLHLAGLHARRRPGWCVVIAAAALALGALWRAPAGDPSPGDAADRTVAAAVLRDGFALTTPAGLAHRVVELDAQGREQRTVGVEPRGEIRVVGSRAGSLVGWREGRRIHLARAGDDRNPSRWGSSVRQLCDGFASNDVRFAIGWLEADDTVWIVHGPLAANGVASSPGAGDADAAGIAGIGDAPDDDAPDNTEPVQLLQVAAREAAKSEWCGIASAERNVAMLWRADDVLHLDMCGKKRCSPLTGRFRIAAGERILGFGCLRTACLVATRAGDDPPRFSFLTETGKRKWTLQLAIASPRAAILGIGDRAFAVGYLGEHGAEIQRIDRDGKATPLWRDPAATTVPALAWSSGKLMIARYHGAALTHEVLAVAR